jgi:hypothetical protein
VVARMVVRRFQGDLRAEESENGGLALLVHWRRAENTDVG